MSCALNICDSDCILNIEQPGQEIDMDEMRIKEFIEDVKKLDGLKDLIEDMDKYNNSKEDNDLLDLNDL